METYNFPFENRDVYYDYSNKDDIEKVKMGKKIGLNTMSINIIMSSGTYDAYNNIEDDGLDIEKYNYFIDFIDLSYFQDVKYLKFYMNNGLIRYIDISKKKPIFPPILEYLSIKFFNEFSIKSDIENCILYLPELPKSIKYMEIIINEAVISNSAMSFDELDVLIEKFINKLNDWLPVDLEFLEANFPIKNLEKFTNLNTYIINDEYIVDYPIINNLPNNLIRLEIRYLGYNHPFENLPVSLEVLIFRQCRIGYYYDGYPHRLSYLPHNLKILVMPDCESMDGDSCGVDLENLPPMLKVLKLPKYNHTTVCLDNLPDSIEYIARYSMHNKCECLQNKLPKSLKNLILRD